MSEKQTDSHPQQAECLKIPVVVGVTGHIDIAENEAYIKKHLDTFWTTVQELVGPKTPIVLLTSIAQGTDHYVVESARRKNIKYCVVLPFKQAVYEQDFIKDARKPTALEEFKEDLAGAFKVIQCDAAVYDYAVSSNYVRSHSDILITLWDGFESLNEDKKPKLGGTYHQIRTAFNLDDILIHHQEKAHLIVNLTVTRQSKHKDYEACACSFPDTEVSALNVVKWDVNANASDLSGFSTQPLEEWVAQFKSEAENKRPKAGLFQKIKNRLLGISFDEDDNDDEDIDIATVLRRIRSHNEQELRLPAEDKRNYLLLYGILKKDSMDFAIIQDDFARYEYFDKRAEGHQNTHKSQFTWIALLSVIVGLLGQAWGDVTFAPEDNMHELIMHGVIFLYLLGCLWLFIWSARINQQNHYGQYIQPRVISELMRLKMFWKLAGITDSFVNYILEDCANYWFALPVCNWEVWDNPLTAEESQHIKAGDSLSAVCNGWLEDQKVYYNGYLLPDPKHFIRTQQGEKCKKKPFFSKAWQKEYFKKYERLDGFFTLLKTIFTLGGFLLASVLVLVYISAKIWHFDHTEFLHLSYYREFIVGICPFVVATLGWLLEKKSWDSLGKKYREMLGYFDKAISVINDNKVSLEDRRRAIKELMLFCHRENTEWKNIKNESKPEPMM